MSKPRLLVLDIETSPIQAFVWGLWKQNIDPMSQIIKHPRMLCWGAMWHGEKRVHFRSEYHHTREQMLTDLRDLMDEADGVVGWNSKRFDRPKVVGQMDQAGLRPPAPSMDVDLMLVARKALGLPSNKLDYVAQHHYGLGGKVVHQGFRLWRDIEVSEDEKVLAKRWQQMKRYQIGDVRLTDQMLERMMPLVYNLPNAVVTDADGNIVTCECGGSDVQRRGWNHTRSGLSYRRYQCQECGSWFQDRKATKRADAPSVKRMTR